MICRTRLSIAVALLAACLIESVPPVASAQDETTQMAVAAVRNLSREEISELNDVRVRGTVTLINREWNILFISEGFHSLKVGCDFETDVSSGSRVEIDGQIVLGDIGPVLAATGIRVLSEEPLPKPLPITKETSFSVELIDQWVEFEGPAYSAVADDKRYYVSLIGEQFGTYALIPRSYDLPPLDSLRTEKLRVRGILAISVEPGFEGQFDLLVPETGCVEVLPKEVDSADIKLRSIGEIGRVDMRGASEAPARIRAVVQVVTDEGELFVSEETGALFVKCQDANLAKTLKPGNVIEAEGRVVRNQQHEYLAEAMIRYLGKGFSQNAKLTPASEALNHPAELVEVDGTLIARDDQQHWLLLKNSGTSFRVRNSSVLTDELSQWGIGSRLRVTGCPWISENLDAGFELFSDRVSVVFGLPAQTAPCIETVETPALTPTDNTPEPLLFRPAVKLTLEIVLVILAALIAWLIHRRLKNQEKFQKSIHEQLSHLSHIARLNTLAEMVGALAHELSQPLASVSNYAATAEILSRKESADPEKLTGVLTSIGQEAFRAGEIIRRLRHLVRKKTPGLLAVQISEIIHETVELFKTQHVMASGLVKANVPENLPAVRADSVQIQQVILNLLLNARDATENLKGRHPAIHVEASFEDGLVHVSVRDNGTGITSSNLDAIFEPYFTTRETGTGLGLAISRTIVETHGGRISAENASPHGSRFTFSLPVSRSKSSIPG